MKIIYLIYVSGIGIGGHYYSLKTTVEAMKEHVECSIIVMGNAESPVINKLDLRIFNIIIPGSSPMNIFKIFYELSKIVNSERPDVLHAFDSTSLFYTKIISHYYKIPYIATLCGGRSPDPVRLPQFGKYYYPLVKNLILYSNENMNYFKNNVSYKNSNIHFIPNRIKPPKQDDKLIREIRKKLDPKANIFLRIARFSNDHKSSMVQAIAVIKELNRNNILSQLIIIGSISDVNVYNDILQLKEENILILTDDKYTIQASKLIDVADIVFGTGRGFMEGASIRKLMLCPSDSSEYSILATPENIFNLFDTNFSSRSYAGSNNNLDALKRVLKDNELNTSLSEYMYSFSKQYFEIESAKDKLIGIYKELKYNNELYLLDILTHLIILIYSDSPHLQSIGLSRR